MKGIPFFLASDNNYAPFIATTMASACANTNSFIEFYILDGGITEENQEKIKSLEFNNFRVEFLKIDVDKVYSKIDYSNANKYISLSTYNRFFIADLKPNINKALYSDVDVIILDDIKKMYDEPLNGHIIGAVSVGADMQKTFEKQIKDLELSQNHNYFAAGNLIIDCKKWRENDVTKKLFEIVYKYNDKLRYHDMDALNKYFDSDYQNLSPKYCWFNQNYDFKTELKEPVVIRHFNGPYKPWDISPDIKEDEEFAFTIGKNEFWKYAKMTPYYEQILNGVKITSLQKFKVYKLMQEKAKIR